MSCIFLPITPSPSLVFPAEPFHEAMQRLREKKQRAESQRRPNIVILGAGPAGLIRGIAALIKGHYPVIVEKRDGESEGRSNTVYLNSSTVALLKKYGIYAYLIENGLVYPSDGNSLNVRLVDLEKAMKAVLAELDATSIIRYSSCVSAIRMCTDKKVVLDLKIKEAIEEHAIPNVDLLVITEGAKGSTNKNILNNPRITFLPALPVISAIFKDTRPTIAGFSSLLMYVTQSLFDLAISIYYHVLFVFKFIRPLRKLGLC